MTVQTHIVVQHKKIFFQYYTHLEDYGACAQCGSICIRTLFPAFELTLTVSSITLVAHAFYAIKLFFLQCHDVQCDLFACKTDI
jgi:hypothetical protein